MIEFKNIGKVFDNGVRALDNINLHVKSGELMTIIGPSGCGKTTTMRMINRLIEPSEGTILINGNDIKQQSPIELRRNIGYVIQQIGLLPHMTIEENISIVPKLKKWEKERYSKRVDELLDLVGLDPAKFKKRYPNELSGGQQQRVGVIRALAADPPIILMDEPFSALDPISREELQKELIHLQREIQKTIVFITHDMDEAIKISNRISIMNEGEIVQVGTPDEILRKPANDFVRTFIGSERLNTALEHPLAINLMVDSVETIDSNRGLAEAFNAMKRKKVDRLFVIGVQNELQGVISLDDVNTHYESETKTVSEIMKTNIPTAQPEMVLPDVVKMMSDYNESLLPVVKNEKVIGLITRSSLIRGMAEWEHQRSDMA